MSKVVNGRPKKYLSKRFFLYTVVGSGWQHVLFNQNPIVKKKKKIPYSLQLVFDVATLEI